MYDLDNNSKIIDTPGIWGFGLVDMENDEISDEEYDEDYFCSERYDLYLDLLTLEKTDVAELTWHYTSSFWTDLFESKEEYLEHTKSCVEDGGFYNVSL